MSFFNVGNRAATTFNSLQEIDHVQPGCRSGIQLDGWFSEVLGIFFLLVYNILMNLLALALRHKIVPHGAAFEGAFLPEQLESPGIIRISWRAPGSVLPNTIELIIFKGCR